MNVYFQELQPLLPFLFTAFGAYVFRLAFLRFKVPLLDGILDAIAATASGLTIGAVIQIYPFPGIAKVAISGVAGFVGPDIVAGLLVILRAFKDSPQQFILKFIYAFKGVKTGMDIPTPPENPLKEPSQDPAP